MKRYLCILLILISFRALSQQPPWYFFNTSISHIIGVPDTISMTIDGVALSPGDFIGAFYYDEFGNLKCGTGTGVTGDLGGMMLNGNFNAATTWGTEPNVYNGFQTGEEFKWKVWRASDGSVFDAVATYLTNLPYVPDSQYFKPNGLSMLASIISHSIPGIDMSLNTIITPQSGCGLTMEYVSVSLQNHDTLPQTGFQVSYVFLGDTVTETCTDTIMPGIIDTFIFSQAVDLSLVGVYHIIAWVSATGDVNPTNDSKYKDVVVSAFPVVNIGPDMAICAGDYQMITTDSLFSSYLWSNGGTDNRIFAYDQGFYSVTVTDALGCTAIDSMFLTVNPLPAPELGADTFFCAGNYINIYTNGNFGSYHWSNNTTMQNLYLTMGGTFSVTVTNQNGCAGSDTITVSMITLPVPAIPEKIITLLPDTLLDAGTGFKSYHWSDGSTHETFRATEWGIYSVTVTNNYGCDGSSTVYVIPGDSSIVFSQLFIFPNPVFDILHVLFPNNGEIDFKIYDDLGQLINSYMVQNRNSYDIDVSYLSQGVYILQVSTGGFRSAKKFRKF